MASEHRTKSPIRERSTSPQRRGEFDYGQDGDKHVRHIARTKELTTFPGQKGTQRNWPWVLKSLAHRRTKHGFGCPIQILDTVIYGIDGAPEALYYTKDGAVVSRTIGDSKGNLTLAKAVAHLRLPARYSGVTHVAAETHGAVSFTTAGETVALKEEDVQKIRKGQGIAPTGTEALVLAVPTRAPCVEPLLSIQHVFNLETSVAKAVHRSFRLVTLKGIAKRIPCVSSTLNRKLERACGSVLGWIEAYSEARVVCLLLEFIEDVLGELWLVRSSKCCITKNLLSYRRQQRSPSPTQSKALRIVAARGIGDEINILRFGHGIGESPSSPSTQCLVGSNISKGGETKQRGSNKRAHKAMSPTELGGRKSPIDADEWGFRQNSSAIQGMDHRPWTTKDVPIAPDQNERCFEQGAITGGRMCRGFAALKERDSKEVGRTPAAGRALGSSQLHGECPGDFCRTNVPDKIEQRARLEQEKTRNIFLRLHTSTEGTTGEVNESPALRRILKLNEAILQRNDDVQPEEDALTNPSKASTSTTREVSRRGRRCGHLDDERSSGPHGSSADVKGEDYWSEWKEIPFSWIVRGRQERHLIDQQLRRYRKDKRGAFVGHLSGLGESSLSLGSIFPATYYQSVQVCPGCFRVYSMMDAARSKSIRSLDAQATKEIHRGVRVHRQGDPPASKKARQGDDTCESGKPEMGKWNQPKILMDPSSGIGKGSDEQTAEIEGEETRNAASMETLALMRAQAAIDGLTRGDICELRSFPSPPAAVNMVVAALMITLTGRGEPTAEGWLSAKRYMTDIDSLFAAISNLNLNNLRVPQLKKLKAYIMNPAFRPDVIASVSLAASRLCAWILGVLEAHRWRTGGGHPRIDTLRGISGFNGMDRLHTIQSCHGSDHHSTACSRRPDTVSTASSLAHWRASTIPSSGNLPITLPSSYGSTCNVARQDTATSRSRITSILGPAVFPFQATGTKTPVAFNPFRFQPLLPKVWVPLEEGSDGGITTASPSRAEAALMMPLSRNVDTRVENSKHGDGGDACGTSPAAGLGRKKRSRRTAMTKRRQVKIAERLADATAAPVDSVEFQRSDFLCSDGVTLIPYVVLGAAPSLMSGEKSGMSEETRRVGGAALRVPPATTTTAVLSFVVVHDFFDTMEKTFLLFKPLVRKHPECQVLCFNSPGQAGTCLPQEPEELLTNTWLAARLDELMQHVDNMGEMPLAAQPFHVLGIGYGANIASAFACHHGTGSRWKLTLKSLCCINGFAAVEPQLAAVLHSAQRVFQCFPPERPDLPITFWSRFIFSEDYIKAVGSDLALNILCAVANPLGAEGMLRIVRGCLNSRDLRKDLSSIMVPLVLIQSTENMLVNAANVDPFLGSRRARHVWSHQLRFRGAVTNTFKTHSPTLANESAPPAIESATEIASMDLGRPGGEPDTELLPHKNTSASVSCLGSAGERALFESLAAGPKGAFVAWVKGGHEVRQECKQLVTDVLELLVAPSGQTEAFFQKSVQTKRAPVGKIGFAAKTISSTEEDRCLAQVPPSCGNDNNAGEGGGDRAVPDTQAESMSAAFLVHDGNLEEKIHLQGGSRANFGTLGGSSKIGCRGRGTVSKSSRRRRELSIPEEVVSEDPTGVQRLEPPTTPGYPSLRIFRRRKPCPEVPKRCGTRKRLPRTKMRPNEATRSRYRSRTVPPTDLHLTELNKNSSGYREHPEGADSTACPQDAREETLSPADDSGNETIREEDEGMGKVGGKALSLEETIADFDNALREHRQRRGVLRAASEALIADDPEIDGGKHNTNECFKQNKENAAVSSWPEGGVKSWATAPPARGYLEDLPWSNEETKGGDLSGVKDESKKLLDQELSIAEAKEYHGESGETPTASHDVDLEGASSPRHRPHTAATGRRLLQTMSENAPDRKLEAKQGITAGPELWPVGEAGECLTGERNNTAEVTPLQVEIIHSKGEAGSELLKHAQKSNECNKMLWDRQPDSKGEDSSEGHETRRDGTKNASEASGASVAIGEIPDQLEKDTRRTRQMFVPSAAEEAVVAREVELDEVPITPPQPGLVTAPDISLHSAPAVSLPMEFSGPISTTEQRSAHNWMEGTRIGGQPPPPLAIALAEAELTERVERLKSQRAAVQKAEREALYKDRVSKLNQEQCARASAFVDEDRKILAAEEQRLIDLRHEADLGRLQRGAEFEDLEKDIAHMGAAPVPMKKPLEPVRGMRPQHYFEAEDLPEVIRKAVANLSSDKVLDEMVSLEARAKAAGGGMSLEEFNKMEQRQCVRQVERLEIMHGKTEEEKGLTRLKMVLRLQTFARSIAARTRVSRLRQERSVTEEKLSSVIRIQSSLRGRLSRRKVATMRRLMLNEMVLGTRATKIQKVYRGRLGRAFYIILLKNSLVRRLQRVIRGFLGRREAKRRRALLTRSVAYACFTTKIQSAWRGKMTRNDYLRTRCVWLASREIQRVYRGHIGRRAAKRRMEWQTTKPGADRLKLGMRLIEDTKVAFMKQQDEIAALNRAQEKAEARVSSIHQQLTASESELGVLEGEMDEIDHLERELVQLTHKRDLASRGITNAAGISRSEKQGKQLNPPTSIDAGLLDSGKGLKRKSEDAYALEMHLQLKRAEREQRRHQLSAEFASTFADVSDKKQQLNRLNGALADIEATRLRKSREFSRLQRNLMELLSEQKRELDNVREKGIQLETAVATSAAAAAATAQRARDHEAKAASMYEQTEELMKFQFMSMSLSYFSSLNMMKQMREINADTTTAAVAGSADAAAAAAASAAAASIPSLKHMGAFGGDELTKALAVRKDQVKTAREEIEEAEKSQKHPFPKELTLWSIDDVCRWLDTLQLSEYKQAFQEGKVDGSFLAELRESDLIDPLGMEHKLHIKKLILAREKLMPMSEAEQKMARTSRTEDFSEPQREGVPDIHSAFSQARHGKKRRLEETLNTGFDIEAEDDHGNTLLITAVQQLQMPIVELLVHRGANVNHINSLGNTALHFAMCYDLSGNMGEYLINNGADDSIENKRGLSPYDGIE